MNNNDYAMTMIRFYLKVADNRLEQLNIDPAAEHDLIRARWGNDAPEKPQKLSAEEKKSYREILEARALRKILEFAKRCGYLKDKDCYDLDAAYDQIMGQIVKMINEPEKWLIK